jgi:hypothetical protein
MAQRNISVCSLVLGLILCGPALAGDQPAAAGDDQTAGGQSAAECCPNCCGCDCGPLWTVRGDALFMTRSRPRSQAFITDGASASLFDASQFDFPTQIGGEVSLVRRLNRQWSVEADYFNLGSQDATVPTITNVTGAGVAYRDTPVGIYPVGFLTEVTSALSYRSQLQSFELNGRKDLSDRLTLLAGFRYFNLNEGGILVTQ